MADASPAKSDGSAAAAALDEIRERREKQARDLAIRQNFRLPQTMAPPKWAGLLDAAVASKEAACAEVTGDARWIAHLRPEHDDVVGSRWLTKLNEEAPVEPVDS
uniref:Uncharacterized protein n=1 Tax=Neobodo designis TaxID=312471 RepID=A0A7S1LEJ1_NEODS|eukprot:CAMPEP_0174840822 /NCGR_PEP_ID=MMETSP1114-20130205/8925_1 /TAXON_ID=312471 /ORGANISM="Neobodo designis, Strain CCAP 1951/1" /LENGTH=104 /DNA_ID=CAMNT_0016074989 /DNA_START=32 /DNA_END=346 /DNA_ORIENTATION=+